MIDAQTRDSYDAFAYAYDRALGERFHQAIRKLVGETLQRYPTPRRTHLDVACGTGLGVALFRDLGFRSFGVDGSMSMLQVARRRALAVAAGDFRALPLRGTFARITCFYDSLNHLKDRHQLVAAFRAIRRLMDGGSLFLFDMNHPDVYPEVWGMKAPFVAGSADYHLEISTTFNKRDRLARALVTGWADLPAAGRVAIRERHVQRAYSEREIVQSLGDAGLAAAEVLDLDPFGEVEMLGVQGVKFFFVCKAA
ncbi:MAG TPA: methyltransferase domain-containing protein [Thermoanaerobaculia bacterium]|nr:methyltransferase domain-containing protein [Thermoanaerobaculia bacterium]